MKALSTFRKYFRWLIWPGLALTTAGLISGFVGTWTTLPIVLLIVGLVLILLSLMLGGFGYRSFWQSRSTQAGTNAVVATLSVLLILAATNFLAVQYGPRIDLTEAGLFTLAPETQTVVRNLQQPVKVVVFDASLNPNDKQLLESYQKFNDDLTYEHINPFQNPGIAREFNVSGEGREVHLETGDTTLFVQSLGVQGLNEQDLTNKLAQLSRDQNAVVYFLQGHDEFVIDGTASGYAQAAAALEADGFTVEPLRFDQIAAVPDDANAVIVAGPKEAFFEPEVDALADYLDQGGSVLLLVDPQTEPELDGLLENWGVTLDDRLIVDASNEGQLVGLGPAAPLVTNYGEHPITADFNNGRSFYPLTRPILVEPVDGVAATPLLLSNAQSYAEALSETGELNVDTEEAPEGPFNIGVVLTKDIETPSQDVTEEDVEEKIEIATENSADEQASEGTADEEETSEEDISEAPDATDEAEDTENSADEQASEDSEDTVEEVEEEQASEDSEDTSEDSEDTADEEETSEEDISEAPDVADEAEAGPQREARLVIIGNATFATDGLFGQQLNGDVFLNTVTWLSNLEDSILSIRPKEITNRRISMTISRQILVIVLALIVLPLIGLIGAGVTWFSRR